MKTAIIIPARFGSTRLPGKPLVRLAGQTILQRVVHLSRCAAEERTDIAILVATDDDRIVHHCHDIGVDVVMTSSELLSGTDRVSAAIDHLKERPDFILNMQGDAPFTPPEFLSAMMVAFETTPCDVITPVSALTWEQLDQLRQNKLTTPFSGTTAIFNTNTGRAYWFSKNIIPALRNETSLRQQSHTSPIFRHIGLYGYSRNMLEIYAQLPESPYEKLEGLEQLRIIENGYDLRCVPVDYGGRPSMSGIDSEEDVLRAEALLQKLR